MNPSHRPAISYSYASSRLIAVHFARLVFLPAETSPLDLPEQRPVLNLEALPDARGVVDGVADELSLLAELEVDVLLVVLALDVGHVDGDEDVGRVALEAQKGEDDGGEVGGGRAVGGGARCLGRDECVGGRVLS